MYKLTILILKKKLNQLKNKKMIIKKKEHRVKFKQINKLKENV